MEGVDTTVSDQIDDGSAVETESQDEQRSTVIDPADHQRAVEDMKKFKSEKKKLEDELRQARKALREKDSQVLKEKEDYRSLWEQATNELTEKDSKLSELKESVFYNARHQAVLDGLRKSGIRPEAEKIIDHYDLSEIEVEVTNKGRFQVGSVSSLVNRIKQEYGFAFEAKKMPRMNTKGGSTAIEDGETLTAAKIAEIERDCKRKGNMKPYYDAVAVYKKQKTGS